VAFLVDVLGLEPGMRVLDVGCGPGRHARALGRRGVAVHGIDISARFVELARADAPEGVTFERLDARALPFVDEFDAAVSLCQGAFGLQGGPATPPATGAAAERTVLEGIARALRPGGRAAVTGFSAYFQVRWLTEAMAFDADQGVNHERTTVKDEAGRDAEVDLWTTCFTPRELRLLCSAAGLESEHVWGVRPGQYARQRPSLDHEELLVVAAKPAVDLVTTVMYQGGC
jgi:SAM-dependent methyltransferase